jgi:hypothetical protein
MEELLVVILQFIVEVGFEVLANLPLEWVPERATRGRAPAMLGWLFVGGCVGWLSTLVLRHTMIHLPALRLLNIVIAPVVSGLVASAWGDLRERRGRRRRASHDHHFWRSFAFTLGLVLMRFAYAAR